MNKKNRVSQRIAEVRHVAAAEGAAFSLPEGWQEGRPEVVGFAIDSVYSPDVDDAVALTTAENGQTCLSVSIADIGGFVVPHSGIALQAEYEVFSRYVNDVVVKPMLPPELSEDRLSLLHEQERPTVTVQFPLPGEYNREQVSVTRTRMRARRISYEAVDDLVRNGETEEALALRSLRQAAQGLLQSRFRSQRVRPADAFIESEFDQASFGHHLKHHKKGPGTLIVAETMIATNAIMAQFASDHAIPFLARNQQVPRKEALPRGSFRKRARLLDSLGLAFYDQEVKGHDALSLPGYTHFTSPIRRLVDFIYHANLAAFLDGREYPYPPEVLNDLQGWINAVERGRRLDYDTSRLAFRRQPLPPIPQIPKTARSSARGIVPIAKRRKPYIPPSNKQLRAKFNKRTATAKEIYGALYKAEGDKAADTTRAAAECLADEFLLAPEVVAEAIRDGQLLTASDVDRRAGIWRTKDGRRLTYLPEGQTNSRALAAVRCISELLGQQIVPKHPQMNMAFFQNEGKKGSLQYDYRAARTESGDFRAELEVHLPDKKGIFEWTAPDLKTARMMACALAHEKLGTLDTPLEPGAYRRLRQEANVRKQAEAQKENPCFLLMSRQQAAGYIQPNYEYTRGKEQTTCVITVYNSRDRHTRPYIAKGAGKNRPEARKAAAAAVLQQLPSDKSGGRTPF